MVFCSGLLLCYQKASSQLLLVGLHRQNSQCCLVMMISDAVTQSLKKSRSLAFIGVLEWGIKTHKGMTFSEPVCSMV